MSKTLKWMWGALLVAAFGMAFALDAYAETNLPVVCPVASAAGKTVGSCAWSQQRFDYGAPDVLVRSCPSASCAFSEMTWQPLGAVDPAHVVEVCAADKSPGDVIDAGECQGDTGDLWGAMRMVSPADVRTAAVEPEPEPEPEPQMMASPLTGKAPMFVHVTWTAPADVTSCEASGLWGGTKPVSGDEVVEVNADGMLVLMCTSPGHDGVEAVDSAKLTWTAPSTNTDGSAYTNAKGFTIHYGTSPSALSSDIALFVPSADTYTIEDLAPGTWYFCVRAVNTDDVSSDCSAVVSKSMHAGVPAQPGVLWTHAIAIDVEEVAQPMPPTDVFVTDAQAVEIIDGQPYFGVAREHVDFVEMPHSPITVFARCDG